MSRKKTSQPQYGEPTAMVSIRMPAALHKEIKVRARKDRISKSRKIVQMLHETIGSAPVDALAEPESVFE